MEHSNEPVSVSIAVATEAVLFARQLADATRADGSLDQNALITAVTEAHRRTILASQTETARFEAVLENMAQGVCFFDGDQRLIISNRRYAEIYRLQPEHVQQGISLSRITEQRHLAETAPAMTPAGYLGSRDHVGDKHRPRHEVVQLQDQRTIAIRYQPMPDGGWISTHEDISERLATEKRLIYLASHDVVTGLPNCLMLAEQLQEVLNRSSRIDPCAVLSLSLDGFRAINDTLDRPIGDDLLRIVSRLLRQHLRSNELLGQQDANEFVVMQVGVGQPAEVVHLAERLLKLLAEPIMLDGHRVAVGASIGITIAFEAGLQAELLIKNANIASHWAKTEGRGNYCLFEPEIDNFVQARRLLEMDLREAVDTLAFELHYQPQIDLQTGRVKAFEALLRWDHPVRGSVPPASFIPLAEEIGLIGRVGQWALEQACIEAAAWPVEIGVGVNVSALQLTDGRLPSIVATALQRSGLSPSRLELEITETCMVENASSADVSLQALRAAGVRIAMDDFGTGYSSLSSMPFLLFDKIKIARSFILRLGDGAAHEAVVRAIVSLCVNFGVTCTAEGVETEDQLVLLADMKCTEVQGYLLGRPGPSLGIPGVLQAFSPRATIEKPVLRSLPRNDVSFTHIVQAINDIVIVTDADLDPPGPKIIYVNPAFTRLTGFEAHEALGLTPRILQGPGTSRTALAEIAAGLRAGHEVQQKVLNYAKCGAPYWLDLRIMPLHDEVGKVCQFVAIQRDVTLDKRRLDELEYVADRDTLTGIPNRRALLRTMDAELQASRLRGGIGPCLAFIDVDHFKNINDKHGHATGDAVLFGIADRLVENVRRADMVGRLGGEEFAVWMPSIALREAAATGERLRWSVAAEPFQTPAGPVRVTVSIGVSEAGRDERSLPDLMARADRAMYVAKQSGRNQVTTEPISALP